MFSALYKGGPGTANWLVHPTVLPELITMTDALGNLIWSPSAAAGMPGKIFDLPIVVTEKVPPIGQPGCILLANLAHYIVGMCYGLHMDVATSPGWHRDYTSFRLVTRLDGQGGWDKPATRPDGGQESWVISLQ